MRATGIRQLFCLPGVQNDPFFDAVVDARDWLEVIVTRHEQGCAYMAMGAAQATGRPTAMCVVPGPWVAQRVGRSVERLRRRGARAGDRRADPLTAARARDYRVLHELDDQPAVLRQITKHAAIVRDTDAAASQIQEAFDQLVSGTPRPVAIEVPGRPVGQGRARCASAPDTRSMPAVDLARDRSRRGNAAGRRRTR